MNFEGLVRRLSAPTLCAGLLCYASLTPAARARADAGVQIEAAVVRIVVTAQRGNWSAPWRTTPLYSSSGSGFVVAGGRFLTSAHVVSDSRYTTVFFKGDPSPHPVRVAAIGHDCDLALLEPEDAGLLASVPPLAFGSLPPLRSTVETYGFPAGGEHLSSTRGVVSRIDVQPYMHSGLDEHVAVQTDAAINPGNSGGPVVADGKVVGVAFQGISGLDNVGYFIPVEVVEHFLRDAADGKYDGFADLGILEPASMENPAARRRAGMTVGERGVRVFSVFPQTSADGVLRSGDILLAVDGRDVANDGTVDLGGMRLPFGVLVDRRQAGDALPVRVLRGGERIELKIPLRVTPSRERFARAYNRLPRYLVYAGLVFVPLDREVLESFGPKWRTETDRTLLHEHYARMLEEPAAYLEEPVLLLGRLEHPVNAALAWSRNVIVTGVNGRPVRGLTSLAEALDAEKGPWQVLEFAPGKRIDVIDRRLAEDAQAEILDAYGIEKDRRL